MFEPDLSYEQALRFSRLDDTHLLSSCSSHPILLEEQNWLTCEHYVQAKLVLSPGIRQRIESAATGAEAWSIAKPWYRRKVSNWQRLRSVLMTRALYTKVQMYDDVRTYLLDTREQLLADTTQYDYYWGLGRDMRGENHMGKIWMSIRDKLRTEGDVTSPLEGVIEGVIEGGIE